jgi:predicted RNA-binding protein with PUA-like domain
VSHEVSLRRIKAEPRLGHLALVRQSRLSVSPVDDEAWRVICELGGMTA